MKFVALLLAALPACAFGKYVAAQVKAPSGSPQVKFVTKFGYTDGGGGKLKYHFTPNPSVDTQIFAGYYDEDWSDVWPVKKDWDCPQMLSKASFNVTIPGNSTEVDFKPFQRPRFWYFVLLNCETTGLDTGYKLTFTNPGGAWNKQFSVDAQGLLPTYLVFMAAFVAGFVTHFYAVVVKWRTEGTHPIIKLFSIAVALVTTGVFCEFVHLAVYAGNGVGAPVMDGISQVEDMGAQLVLMLLLILIAKGWTISTTKLTDRRLMFIVLSAFMFVYVALFIWQEAGQDPAATDYVYASVPGIILLVMRVLTLVWFLYCLFRTFQVEIHPDKRRFYLTFGALYTLWFLALPVIVGVASVLDPWVRKKTVTAIYLLFNVFALTGLGWLLWPSRAHVYFKISGPDVLSAASTPYDQI